MKLGSRTILHRTSPPETFPADTQPVSSRRTPRGPKSAVRHVTVFPVVAGVVAAICSGCVNPSPAVDDPIQRDMLSLLMPRRIDIVEPFTRIASFDDDATPDGIELLLQAVNYLDNPGLMIAGNVRIELFEFVPASGEPRGKRIDHWEIHLETEKQQRAFWNGVTQMYKFHLAVPSVALTSGRRYVLAVTYHSPLGDRLTDEFVMRFGPAKRPG